LKYYYQTKWNNNNNWTTCYYTAKILCIKKLMLREIMAICCIWFSSAWLSDCFIISLHFS
jgi:hypothetical protein